MRRRYSPRMHERHLRQGGGSGVGRWGDVGSPRRTARRPSPAPYLLELFPAVWGCRCRCPLCARACSLAPAREGGRGEEQCKRCSAQRKKEAWPVEVVVGCGRERKRRTGTTQRCPSPATPSSSSSSLPLLPPTYVPARRRRATSNNSLTPSTFPPHPVVFFVASEFPCAANLVRTRACIYIILALP